MLSRLPIGANAAPEYGQPFTESLRERYGVAEFNQGIGAELMADRWKLSRTRLDEFLYFQTNGFQIQSQFLQNRGSNTFTLTD